MKFARLGALAVATAAIAFAGSASAIPIQVGFNFVPTGGLTANTGDVTTATTITVGAPLIATSIILNNINLIGGQSITMLPNALGVNIGDMFTKTFVTSLGTFVESLTVVSRTPGPTSLGVTAVGTITQTVGVGFDPTPVFYSAAYTQNQGPGGQINASYNNSTVDPVRVPEPTTLALVGLALTGLALARKAKKA